MVLEVLTSARRISAMLARPFANISTDSRCLSVLFKYLHLSTCAAIFRLISVEIRADSSARALNAVLSLTLCVGCKEIVILHDGGQ